MNDDSYNFMDNIGDNNTDTIINKLFVNYTNNVLVIGFISIANHNLELDNW